MQNYRGRRGMDVLPAVFPQPEAVSQQPETCDLKPVASGIGSETRIKRTGNKEYNQIKSTGYLNSSVVIRLDVLDCRSH